MGSDAEDKPEVETADEKLEGGDTGDAGDAKKKKNYRKRGGDEEGGENGGDEEMKESAQDDLPPSHPLSFSCNLF